MGRGVCAPAGVGQVIARDLPGSLQLAFVGDTVYDLFVRERLARGGGRMDDLHRAAVRYVCAAAQSAALARVEPLLTEEEAAVVLKAAPDAPVEALVFIVDEVRMQGGEKLLIATAQPDEAGRP